MRLITTAFIHVPESRIGGISAVNLFHCFQQGRNICGGCLQSKSLHTPVQMFNNKENYYNFFFKATIIVTYTITFPTQWKKKENWQNRVAEVCTPSNWGRDCSEWTNHIQSHVRWGLSTLNPKWSRDVQGGFFFSKLEFSHSKARKYFLSAKSASSMIPAGRLIACTSPRWGEVGGST